MRAAVMIALGLYILFGFGFETVWKRLWIEVDGTIISRVEVPPNRPGRYRTDYVFRLVDGRTETYSAGATDASLARSLPVGSSVSKHRWELGYGVNGRWIGFPLYFYGPVLVLGVWLLAMGIGRGRQESRARAAHLGLGSWR